MINLNPTYTMHPSIQKLPARRALRVSSYHDYVAVDLIKGSDIACTIFQASKDKPEALLVFDQQMEHWLEATVTYTFDPSKPEDVSLHVIDMLGMTRELPLSALLDEGTVIFKPRVFPVGGRLIAGPWPEGTAKPDTRNP